MPVATVDILGNTIFELITIRATCKVLDMRYSSLFAISILALMGLSFAFRASGMPEGLRVAIISPLSFFVLPMAFSRGPVRKRISRILLLVSAALPAEYAGAITYSLFSGQSMYPSTGAEIPTSEHALIYTSCILTSAIMYEAVVAFCMRSDDRNLVPLNLSVIALVLQTYFLFGFIFTANNTQRQGFLISVAGLMWTILSFVIAVTTQELAQRDAQAMRDHANRVAIIRQARHMKREIEAMAHASFSVRRLRHDLANQVDVVDELMGTNHADVAERLLSDLQVRTNELTKDSWGQIDER